MNEDTAHALHPSGWFGRVGDAMWTDCLCLYGLASTFAAQPELDFSVLTDTQALIVADLFGYRRPSPRTPMEFLTTIQGQTSVLDVVAKLRDASRTPDDK